MHKARHYSCSQVTVTPAAASSDTYMSTRVQLLASMRSQFKPFLHCKKKQRAPRARAQSNQGLGQGNSSQVDSSKLQRLHHTSDSPVSRNTWIKSFPCITTRLARVTPPGGTTEHNDSPLCSFEIWQLPLHLEAGKPPRRYSEPNSVPLVTMAIPNRKICV